MPRKAGIDAPGALHHIFIRGIERRRIFRDDQGPVNLIERPGGIVSDTKTFGGEIAVKRGERIAQTERLELEENWKAIILWAYLRFPEIPQITIDNADADARQKIIQFGAAGAVAAVEAQEEAESAAKQPKGQ
jgi:hypothetical protein